MSGEIISAISGLAGVVVGSFIPIVREWFMDRKRRAYAAIRVVCVLDKFVEDCAKAVGQEGQDDLLPVSPWPTGLDYPADLDWRLLDGKLIYRLLALPNRAAAAANAVSFVSEVASTEHDPQHLTTVNERYVPLGISAAGLARELRCLYGLPEGERADWNPLEYLKASAEKNGVWRIEAGEGGRGTR